MFITDSDAVTLFDVPCFNSIIDVIYVFKDIPFTFHEFCLSIA